MRWIKRNLLLLIGILVAIGLMAGAVVYLITRIKADQSASKKLKEAQQQLITLMQSAPFPSQQNLGVAQQETQKLVSYMTNVQARVTYPAVPKMTSQEFSSFLLTTISDLQKSAEQGGVTLPPRYGFSFEPLREQINFDAASIEPLSRQLIEVKELCEILFRNRIHNLESLRRVRVSLLDPPQAPQYLPDKAVNPAAYNGLATVTPYEVVFTGFSSELAHVLTDLEQSKIFFSVKVLNQEDVKMAAPTTPVVTAEPSTQPGGRPRPPARGAKPAETAAPKDELYLFEKPLRFHLFVETVRLNLKTQ